jgi:hypothetical protein
MDHPGGGESGRPTGLGTGRGSIYNGHEEGLAMPLRDHFRPPLDDLMSWEGFHGQWPGMIVVSLFHQLPRRYVATPRIHADAFVEVDVATNEKGDPDSSLGVPTADWEPPKPTLSVATNLPDLDEYEVRVYDSKRGRRLVAAVEIVSPVNKGRPEHRRAFVAKCAALLQKRVSVAIIDLVTTRGFNLYSELLELIGHADPSLTPEPPSLYAAACRWARNDDAWLLETWVHNLELGRPLPTLPLWLAADFAVPLDLEESYEETCRILRIP